MLKPVGNRILVRRQEPETKIGSIHIPDTAQKKVFRGTVLAVGPGIYKQFRLLPPCPEPGMEQVSKDLYTGTIVAGVKAGDTVVFGEYSGHEVQEGAEKLVVLEEDDVLLVVVPDPAPAAP